MQEKRQGDILEYIHGRQKIEELEDQSDLPPSKLSQRCVAGRLQCETVDHDFAVRGMIEAGEEMDQRAFAATARTADRDELVSSDLDAKRGRARGRFEGRSYTRG